MKKFQATKDDIQLNEELKLIVIAVYDKYLACRIFDTEILINFKPVRLNIYPTTILTVNPEKFWLFSKTAYVSGKILKKEIDFDALKFIPLKLEDCGKWDPEKDFYYEEDQPLAKWQKEIIKLGIRDSYEFEDSTPLIHRKSFDSDPVSLAMDAKNRGDFEKAIKLLMDSLKEERRYIDAYVHLGTLCFGYNTKRALIYYNIGVNIGNLSLPKNFNGVLAWGFIENRPYLRALYNSGLCYWKMKDFEKALEVFRKILILNPMDNQGARFLIPDIENKITWEEYQEKDYNEDEYGEVFDDDDKLYDGISELDDEDFDEFNEMVSEYKDEYTDEDYEYHEILLERKKVEWNPGPYKDKKLLEAQNLLWDARESGDNEYIMEAAKKAVKISSKCSEAWHILGTYTQNDIAKSVSYFKKALKSGKQMIGTKDFHNLKGYFILHHYCIPYLKALSSLSYHEYLLNQYHSSAEHLEEILELDFFDDFESKYRLIIVYFELGKNEKAQKLLDDNKGSLHPLQFFLDAINNFIVSGDNEESREKLIEADKNNKKILKLILKRKNDFDRYDNFSEEMFSDIAEYCVGLLMPFLYEKEDIINWMKKIKHEIIDKIIKFPQPQNYTIDEMINKIKDNIESNDFKNNNKEYSFDLLETLKENPIKWNEDFISRIPQLISLNKNSIEICLFILLQINMRWKNDDSIGNLLIEIIENKDLSIKIRQEAMSNLASRLDMEIKRKILESKKISFSNNFMKNIEGFFKDMYFNESEDVFLRQACLIASAVFNRAWISEEVEKTYKLGGKWKTYAIYAMKFVPGFNKEIIESLEDKNQENEIHAIIAAGERNLIEALPFIEYRLMGDGISSEFFNILIIAMLSMGHIDKINSYIRYFLHSPDPEIRAMLESYRGMIGE